MSSRFLGRFPPEEGPAVGGPGRVGLLADPATGPDRADGGGSGRGLACAVDLDGADANVGEARAADRSAHDRELVARARHFGVGKRERIGPRSAGRGRDLGRLDALVRFRPGS